MPNTKITLPDGTTITVEGEVGEVERIVAVWASVVAGEPKKKAPSSSKKTAKKRKKTSQASVANESVSVDYAEISNTVHDCEDSDAIAKRILDEKDVMNRVLLPLYISHKYFNDEWSLTSGDIQKITDDLKVKVSTANASRMLSGKAKKYVRADGVRKQGGTVRYSLNRPGIQYMEKLLSNGDE